VPCSAEAAKLDKAACADLSKELAAITATGVKADMQRGPEWAKANMPIERLQSIRRLLEIEDQLEFRCARGGKQKDKGPAPAPQVPGQSQTAQPSKGTPVPTSPVTEKRTSAPAMVVVKPPVAIQPEPSKTPSAATPVKNATAPPTAAPVAPSAAAAPATVPPAAGPVAPAATGTMPAAAAPATATPSPSKSQSTPVVAATPPVASPPSAPGPSASPTATQPAPAAAPAAKPAAQAARRKRHKPSSAYVSPNEVNPFSLPGMR
jgi:hypothetical protein